jgi:hypothetical protein
MRSTRSPAPGVDSDHETRCHAILCAGERDKKKLEALDAKAKQMIGKWLAHIAKLLRNIYPTQWRSIGQKLTDEEVVDACWVCNFPWRAKGEPGEIVKKRLQLYLAYRR